MYQLFTHCLPTIICVTLMSIVFVFFILLCTCAHGVTLCFGFYIIINLMLMGRLCCLWVVTFFKSVLVLLWFILIHGTTFLICCYVIRCSILVLPLHCLFFVLNVVIATLKIPTA